jgi:hypothetical protein
MKAMQPASARALTVTATVVLFVGFLIPSPSGAFLAFGLAALLAVVPTIFGPGKMRLVAAVLLLCSIGLAANKYPNFKSEQERYRQKKPTALHTVDRGGKEPA